MSDSLRHHGLYSSGNSSGQNTGMGSFSLLQRVFPTQGIKPRFSTLQADSLSAEPLGKPKRYMYAQSLSCVWFFCHPMDCSPLDSSVHGIFQARTLEWVAISCSNVSSAAAAAAAKSLQSCPTLCDPIDGSPPGSPSLGSSRQEHWSGLPFPTPM